MLIDDKINMLGKKLQLLIDMLVLTKSASFENIEDAPQNYINMVDEREKVLENLQAIDNRLNLLCYKNVSNQKTQFLESEIKNTVGQIIAIDEEISKFVPKINSFLKDNMKKASVTKDVTSKYQGDLYFDNISSFDKRN